MRQTRRHPRHSQIFPNGKILQSARSKGQLITENCNLSNQHCIGRDHSGHSPLSIGEMRGYFQATGTTYSHAVETVEDSVDECAAIHTDSKGKRFSTFI